jgi:hypothetical protein
LLAANPSAGDGVYWIDPDGAGGGKPFSVWCDMTLSGGGWTRVDELSHFGFAIHTEAERTQSYSYELSVAQINAIRAVSTEGRQDWQCQTVGIGAAYPVVGWDNTVITYAACWDPANAAYLSSSGTHLAPANLPFKEWHSVDCGDVTEACQHNVGPAYFR